MPKIQDYFEDLDFNIPTYSEGDSLARYFIRVDEMRESNKIVKQILSVI